MMGADAPPDEGKLLGELELSAVSEAMNQMMGNVATAMAKATGAPDGHRDAETTQLDLREEATELEDARYTVALHAARAARSRRASCSSCPQAFADDARDGLRLGGRRRRGPRRSRQRGARGVDTTRRSRRSSGPRASRPSRPRRCCRRSSRRASSATLPEIEVDPDDPLGQLSYPLVTVEVSYVSGVNGANLFVLTPEQAATLAAVDDRPRRASATGSPSSSSPPCPRR